MGTMLRSVEAARRASPAVSVIVPTRDRARVLPRALRTVLDQTFTDLEVLVVDDGSTDPTRDAALSLGDPRVVYIRQASSGVSVARNKGVAVSTGRVVTFLDSDDEVRPRWLEHLMSALDDPEVAVATCTAASLGDDGAVTGFRTSSNHGLPTHPSSVFLAGTFAVRRGVFEAVGGYAPGLQHSENTDLGLRLVSYCRATGWGIVASDDPLLIVHVPDDRRDYSSVRLDATRYMLDHHGSILATQPKIVADYMNVAGVCAARIGRFGEARRWFLEAVRVYPQGRKSYGRLMVSLSPRAAERVWGRVAPVAGSDRS